MENQSKNALKETVDNNQRPAMSITPAGQPNFIPITEMFDTPDTLLADALATDPDSVARVDLYKTDIQKYGIDAMASLGVAVPSFATDTYNPVDQQNPPDNTYSKLKSAFTLTDVNEDQRVAPGFAGMRQSQFMRYYKHPDFSDLGFSPYANMESYYNVNSTVYDDMTRMWSQYTSLAGSGFSSVYRSIGDAFDGDSYWSAPDLESASEFEDAMGIGNSSRSGGMAWTNNFLLNSAYTVGILSSIAVEELAMAGATVLTGGGAAPAAGVRTAVNVGRAGNAFKNFFNVSRFAGTTRDIYRTLRNTEHAKSFYEAAKTGGKVLGQMFAPNTMYALNNLKTAKNATQNGVNLAKMSSTFGGFYRDVRMVNYAMAESKMEAGMVYNDVMRTGIDTYNKNNLETKIVDGKEIKVNVRKNAQVSPEEMKVIREKSSKAGFYTQMANAPIIYASNWFVLGNALGGFNKSLGRMMNDTFRKGLGGKIIKTKATRSATGALNKNVFEATGTGLKGYLRGLRAAGVKGSLSNAAGASLRYFSNNVAEGIQEVSQEAVSAATKGYFTAVLNDPMAGGITLRNQMISSGMGHQLSGEGFSVFMSGFLMGGAIQGPQKLFFQGVPAIYKAGKGKFGTEKMKAEYAEYKKNRKDLVQEAVNGWNKAWNSQVDNPGAIFDDTKFNYLIQKQVSEGMKTSSYDQDMFGFIDQKDLAKFSQIHTLLSQGGIQQFTEQLEDYLKLTDEELLQAFPGEAKDIANGKIRGRIQDFINYAEKTESNYNNLNDKFENPYDPSAYEVGTREFALEALNYQGYQHAKYLLMYTQDNFERALERSESIFSNLEMEPLFEKMAAKDISILTSIDNINREIALLTQEIMSTVEIDENSVKVPNKGVGETNKRKQQKIENLQSILKVISDPKNQTKNGTFDRRKITKLRPAFKNYVRYLASTEGSFLERDKVDTALKQLVDYYALKGRAQVYDKAVEYLSNPARLNEITQRTVEYGQNLYKNIKSQVQASIEKYLEITETNEVMNQLAVLGVYPDPSETKAFLQTGDISNLKTFYNENGKVEPKIDTILYGQIERIIETYTSTRATEEKTEAPEKKETEKAEETRTDQNDILKDLGVDVELEKTNDTPMLNELLERQYRKYKATAAISGENVLLFEEWRNSIDGLNFQNTFNALKRVWASGVVLQADSEGNPYKTVVTRENVTKEEGFKDWFRTREVKESPIVKRILDQAGLVITDIVESETDLGKEGDTLKGNKNRKIYKRGTQASIIRIKTKDQETGELVEIYKLVDNNGNPISNKLLELIDSKFGAFSTPAEAVAALKKIEATAPDTATFLFDEVELQQGEILFDKLGNKYIVLSTPKQVQGGYLRIIEASKNTNNLQEREKSVIKLQPGQFKGRYSLQEIKMDLLPATTSRLEINDVISPYPYKNSQESRALAQQRYNHIISQLSPVELAQLELYVIPNPEAGKLGRYYAIESSDGKVYKESNPYIRRIKSKYDIGIRIADEKVRNKVNQSLREAGFQVSEDVNGIFAYLPNESYVFYDNQNNPIDPRNITKEQALNTLYVPKAISKNLTKEETLELARNNFALNAMLVETLDGMNISEPTAMLLQAFPKDIGLSIGGAQMAYGPKELQESRSLSSLNYQHADTEGNYLVYDLKRDKGGTGRTIQSKTNLEGKDATALRNKVKTALEQSGQWDAMIAGTDRYLAAVLLPNGQYGLVNLKTTRFSQAEVENLYTELIERAQLTQKENLDEKGEAKNEAYNIEYNDDLANGLFISTKPGFSVALQVTPWGKIQMDVFDKNSKKQVGETITINQKIINDKKMSSVKKIQTLINNFNEDTEINLAGINVTVNNLRRSFADTASVEEVINNSETNVLPSVIENQSLRVTGTSADIQASRDAAATVNDNKTNDVKPNAQYTIAEEAAESILDLSDAEFDAQLEEEFANFKKEFLGHIVNKIVRGEELSAREQQAYKFLESKINMLVAKEGGAGSVTINNDVKADIERRREAEIKKVDEQVRKRNPLGNGITYNMLNSINAKYDKELADLENKTDVVSSTPLAVAQAELQALKAKLSEGVDGRSVRKVLKNNEEYQKLKEKVRKLGNISNKILPFTELNEQEIENIDTFSAWALGALPSYITIEDIDQLRNNQKAGGMRVGAFVMSLKNIAGGLTVDGTIYTGATSPFKYHEAFHSVFRMLLSDTEIQRYRSIARKEVRAKLRSEGKNFKTELEIFRNSADTYSNMTEKELMNEYYEEYLADEFEKFKMSPSKTKSSPEIKSLFTRILDFIKTLFSTPAKNELSVLFESIDAGKYQNAPLASNEFTQSLQEGVTLEANALVPYSPIQTEDNSGNVRTGYLYLDNDIADPLIRSIAAMYLDRTSKITEATYSPAIEMDEILNDFAWLYSPSNPNNLEKSDTQIEKLEEIEEAFDIYDVEIKTEVIKLLNVLGDQINETDYTLDELEDSTGLRSTSQYDIDASLIGGHTSLSSKLKTYIATTTLSETDYFGNTELKDGVPLIVAVDFVEAYNGLLKAVKNISDPKKILQSMYFFGQENAQVGAVVNRLLQDVGITTDELVSSKSLGNLTNPSLLQSVVKAFENFRVDYIFNERDELGNIRIYSAAQRDDINSQLDRWNQAWISKWKIIKSDKNTKDQTLTMLEEFETYLSGKKQPAKKDKKASSKTTLTNQALSDISLDFSRKLFDLVGIRLSPLYLQYSILQNRPKNTVKQKALVNLYSDETPLLATDIKMMSDIIQSNADIFATDDSGMDSRLREMSIHSAPFDETIGASVFKNPNGDLVYAHQKPTLHLKSIADLNNPGKINELKLSDEYLLNNFLLNSAAFELLSAENRLKVLRIAGSKVGQVLSSEQDLNDSITGITSTQTYGDFTSQEFALAVINNYTALLNTKSNKVDSVEGVDVKGNKFKRALAPVLIRVMEASNTGDLISLPVLKAVDFNNGTSTLSDKLINVFVDRIRTEFARINREAFTMDSLTQENEVLGYNTKNGRAYQFTNNSTVISSDIQEKLRQIAIREGKAQKEITLDAAIKEISTLKALKNNVKLNLNNSFDQFMNTLTELNMLNDISNNVSEGPVNAAGVQRKELVDSARLLNLNYDTTHNLKQIFFNDWANTGAINEIILGDQAVSLKDSVDRIKRAKMQNAAYDSAYSAVSAPSHGVTHNVEKISLVTLQEPVGESSITGQNIDQADAQMYLTTKAFRYLWFGFGRLSPSQAAMIDNIEAGQSITSDDIFGSVEASEGYIKKGAMLNSKKLVYGDGSTFLKMSAFVLTPEFTSRQLEDGTWIAKPHRVKLHNLRVKLEAIESEPNAETLGIAAPLSAIKMKKQGVNTLEELDNPKPFTNPATQLDARYMGLQVINPSNKLEVLDPTQIKQIITSEQKDNVKVEALGLTVGEIKQAYNKAVSQRVVLNYKNKRNLVFTLETALDELKLSSKPGGGVTPNLAAFLTYAQEGLKASKSSQQILDFFSMTDGVQNYDLNNPLVVQKAEQLFLSYFSKGVLSEKSPGTSLTLLSDFGNKVYRRVYEVETIEKNGDFITIPVRSEIIREKTFAEEYSTNDLTDLNTITSDTKGLSEGLIVLDDLRHGLMEYTDPKDKNTSTGLRYTEMMMPSHYKNVMDLVENVPSAKLPEAISKMFGVRIPSQDNHSAVNMKMVDFLPAYYGSTAMFAKELVEVSGADFDIDKVFSLMKEFYVQDGEFIEYGKGNLYEEYIRYANQKTNTPGTTYSEALSLFAGNELKGATKVTDAQIKSALKAGLEKRTIRALQTLGLPVTSSQFDTYNEKHGVPFAAPLNNQVLDYRYALIGNKGVSESKDGVPISYQAANTDVLWNAKTRTGVLAELAEVSDVFKERIEEGNIDVDNMTGKIKAFTANKGASIGAVVLPNLYLSLLTEYNVKLTKKAAIYLNGQAYNDYGKTEYKQGGRKQDVLSALITMATDNAKDRLVAKLGLNRHAVGLLANLTALTVPLKTALLLVNNPTIQDIYSQALNKSSKLDPGVSKLTDLTIAQLEKVKGKRKFVRVDDALLIDALNNPEDVSTDEMWSILNVFSKGTQLKDFTSKMGAPTSLTKGLGASIAEVNQKYKDTASLFTAPPGLELPMDVKPIYYGNTWQNTYLKIFTQITNDLLPATFISTIPQFNEILDPAISQMNTNTIEFTEDVMAKVRLDLLSYLSIKAYQKKGLDSDAQSVATLSNDIIYPTEYNSIVDVIDRLRTTDVGKNNFFLDNYVITTKASESNAGFNQANSNTFRQLNAGQKIQLQNDFAKLYGSLETRNDAKTIINYEMVKGGLQLGYGSLLSVISPVVLTSYLDTLPSVEKALKGQTSFVDTFGITVDEMKAEFSDGYLLSNANNSKLFTIETDEITPLPSTVRYDRTEKKLVIKNTEGSSEAPSVKYLRIGFGNITGQKVYKTFRYNTQLSSIKQNVFNEVDTMGSNQQNGIGFMFGDRPTYTEVREYVRSNGGVAGTALDVKKIESEISEMSIDENKFVQQEALKNESSIITATEEGVNISYDVEGKGVNISDIKQLKAQKKDDKQSINEQELEGNIIEDVDQAMPEMTAEQEQLTLDLQFELADSYDIITEEFDAITKDKAARLTLINQNLFPLSNMIEAYESRFSKDAAKTSEESQKDFIDNIKRCILK